MAIDVTYGGSVVGGLVSFLSPCVLPLVPPYLCYMAGASLGELTAEDGHNLARRRVIVSAGAFVLGFATIFVATRRRPPRSGNWSGRTSTCCRCSAAL